jgi:MSHA pilin protein MshA
VRLGRGGMSLIELIIVMLVFGALAVIAIPRYLNLQQEARRAARDSLTGNETFAEQCQIC